MELLLPKELYELVEGYNSRALEASTHNKCDETRNNSHIARQTHPG